MQPPSSCPAPACRMVANPPPRWKSALFRRGGDEIDALVPACVPVEAIADAIEVGLEIEQKPRAFVVEDFQHLVDDLALLRRRLLAFYLGPFREPFWVLPTISVGNPRL